jgi:diguanylate cyclase (GGDEF)-like protein
VNIEVRSGDRPDTVADPRAKARRALGRAQRAAAADRAAAAADQAAAAADHSAADADQTFSDADQTASTADQASAERDQLASDRDQATADRDQADHALTAADESAYAASRDERDLGSFDRLRNRLKRGSTAHDRDLTADQRDRVAETRDEVGRARDVRVADLTRASSGPEAALMRQLEELGAKAAVDRARAAADRARAAKDRADAAVERARLEAELRSAHLDELTGAYRREMGRLALSHEIDRARRSDGRFVLAFVDVDRFKVVNDRDGHAAGDRVLQAVVRAIRAWLRSFDPIIRYGGDEFVCGLSGTDLAEAERRFDLIGKAIEADASVGISVGFAALSADDTADLLTERADAAMLVVKAKHHVRE